MVTYTIVANCSVYDVAEGHEAAIKAMQEVRERLEADGIDTSNLCIKKTNFFLTDSAKQAFVVHSGDVIHCATDSYKLAESIKLQTELSLPDTNVEITMAPLLT